MKLISKQLLSALALGAAFATMAMPATAGDAVRLSGPAALGTL